MRLKAGHPDLSRAKRAIAELERRTDAEALEQPLTPGSPGSTLPAASAAGTAAPGSAGELGAERDALNRGLRRRSGKKRSCATRSGVIRSRSPPCRHARPSWSS